MPTEKQVLDKLSCLFEHIVAPFEDPDPVIENMERFTLEDLVGKTISKPLRIKNSGENPSFLKVQTFQDESYMLCYNHTWHDGSTMHFFLVEKDRIRLSRDLYHQY